MDLDTYLELFRAELDRLRAGLDRIDELRARQADPEGSVEHAAQEAAVALGDFSELERLSGLAAHAALEQARKAGVDLDVLALRGAQVHADALPAKPDPTAGPAGDALALLEQQIDEAAERLREAVDDHEALGRIMETDDPALRGRAGAHRTLAAKRWSAALGARAALEAVYQELAGRPSPQHEADAGVLDELGHPPSRVGLEGPDPDTAAFLAAHAPDPDRDATRPCERRGPDRGLDR